MKAFQVYGPDDIPIEREPFATRELAEAALKAFPKRFERQGYYSGVGYRLPVAEVESHCRIEEEDYVMEDDLEEAADLIDAAIFSGDFAESPLNRARLRELMARWERGLFEAEAESLPV
jgi:hypothetical protein